MIKFIQNLTFCLALVYLTSCSSSGKESDNSSENTAEMDRRTEIRLKQYTIEGKKLFQTYCMNCHMKDGEGLAKLYPPLAKSDYLLEDLPRAACTIKNGSMGGVTVNGINYNQMMPGNPALTPLEIAEILTYITNSWGNNEGLSGVKEVEKWLQECNPN